MTEWMELLRNQADPVLATTPLTYQPNGGNAYIARSLDSDRAHVPLDRESRYAERAWREAMTHYPIGAAEPTTSLPCPNCLCRCAGLRLDIRRFE